MIISVMDFRAECGSMRLASVGDRLCMCDWIGSRKSHTALDRLSRRLACPVRNEESECCLRAVRMLQEYFAAGRRTFDLPLFFCGTEFQMQVWKALQAVPYGSVESYSAVAARIGRPDAVRAVASAIAANVISVFVPCHRIVGSQGALTGYRGGLDAKRFLLGIESR